MAVQFTSEPVDDLNVTNQHLIYVMNDAVETPDRYIVQVYEQNYIFGGDGTLIAKIYITPNEQNRGVFDLGDLVNNRLAPPTRLTYQSTNRFVMTGYNKVEKADIADTVARKYTLRVGRIKDGTETLNQDSSFKYLMGGAWQLKDGKHPSLSDYYTDALANTAKAWLTNLPNKSQVITRYMGDEDEGRVGIVATTYLGATTYINKVTIELFEADGTSIYTETLTSISSSPYLPSSFYWIPCGPGQLQQLFGGNWDDRWDYLEITPLSSSNVQVGAKYVVRRDCRPLKHEPVQLAWTNTVGGWDGLRFDGRAPKTIQKNEKRFRKDPLTWQEISPSWNTWDRQNTTFHNEGKIRFTLTHDQFTADERALLEYCMRSRLVYYRYGTEDWAPCVVDTNSLVIEPAGSKMFRVSLVIEDANPVRC